MFTTKPWTLAVMFLCTLGWVCIGPAIGADDEDSAAGTEAADAVEAVQVSNFDTVQLNVQDTDLGSVLQLLSVQSRRNIVPSTKVSGKVTANLYDVTFHEALDAILQQNGCGYIEKGNFIYVYTQEEIQKIQQAERRVTHRVFRLNYITATDASTFITPLLSSAGSIAVSGNVTAGFQPTISDAGADSFADTHVMIVRDYPEYLEEIARVIADLDVKPRQVLVEATILQADITEETAFGVDFSILTNLAVDTFTRPLGAISEAITGTTATPDATNWGGVTSSVGNVETGAGGLRVGVVTNNVAAFIRALDSITDTVILANPKVMVVNRQRAEVHVGQKVGYLSTTATATATTQTVEFLDVGTKLILRPFVSDDGFIRMELKPSISEAQIRNVIPGTNTAAVTIPDEITQELTTNVMVRDGQTVVLGGLFREQTEIARNQVPWLGDLPLVGNAFKGRDDTVERDEVIFLITPHVVKDEAVEIAGAATRDSIEMIRVGAREGLLPWSRSKMAAAHLRDALRYIEQDNREMALWEVDLALGMNAIQPEALRLKERLTGERIYWPDQSLLDEAVDVMVEKQRGLRRQNKRSHPMEPDTRPVEPGHDDPLFPEAMSIAPADEARPILDVQPNRQTIADQAAEATIVDREPAPAAATERVPVEATDVSIGEAAAPVAEPATVAEAEEAELAVPVTAADEATIVPDQPVNLDLTGAEAAPSVVTVEPHSAEVEHLEPVTVPEQAESSTPIAESLIGSTTTPSAESSEDDSMPAVLKAAIEQYEAQNNGAAGEDDDLTASVEVD